MSVWEQELREFRWLLKQAAEADAKAKANPNDAGLAAKKAKAQEKFDNWRRAHPEATAELTRKVLNHEEQVWVKAKPDFRRLR